MALRTPSEFTSWFDKTENSVEFWKKKYENSEKKFQTLKELAHKGLIKMIVYVMSDVIVFYLISLVIPACMHSHETTSHLQ